MHGAGDVCGSIAAKHTTQVLLVVHVSGYQLNQAMHAIK